jgi:hypothetical protein
MLARGGTRARARRCETLSAARDAKAGVPLVCPRSATWTRKIKHDSALAGAGGNVGRVAAHLDETGLPLSGQPPVLLRKIRSVYIFGVLNNDNELSRNLAYMYSTVLCTRATKLDEGRLTPNG